MSRLKEVKYFTLVMLLGCFIAASALNSCREQKKQENTEEQAGDEHPAKDGDEHPAKDGEEHPAKEGEEHPKDSVSG